MSARPVIRRLADLDDVATLSDAAAGTASLRTLGTGATQAAAGNHGHTLVGDVSGAVGATVVADDSHAHTTTTISGLDAADTTTGTFATARIPSITAAMVAADVATQAELDASALLVPILANATAARNTLQPTADVAALTLKSLNAAPAANTLLQSWQQSNGTVFGAISDVGVENLGITTRTNKRAFFTSGTSGESVALALEKADGGGSALDLMTHHVAAAQGGVNADGAALRVFNIDSDRGTGSVGNRGQEPATWIAHDGGIYTHKYIIVSGTTAGALDTWQMQLPSAENNMISVWSDIPDATLLLRASTTAGAYNLACLDDAGNHRLIIEKNGVVKWGETTKAAMDVTLGRELFGGVNLLAIGGSQGHLGIANNKFVYSKKNAGTLMKLFTVDTSDVLGIGDFDNPPARTQVYGKFRVLETVSPFTLVFDITATQIVHGFDTAIADGKNIVLATTTGTKLGTGATQKLGHWGSTPVVQPAAYTQTYTTATRTNANPTAVTLTDNSGGTANTTLELIAGAVYATDAPGIKNNFADLAAAVNALVVDVANNKQLINALIDDKQATGLCAP